MKGRRVVVVGASAGIGRAVAVRAIDAGADVTLVGRRADRLDDAIAEAGGGQAIVADIASEEGCHDLGEQVAADGDVDLVLHAAGAAPFRLVADTTTEEWDHVLRTNVLGFQRTLQALLPSLAPPAIVAALSSETVSDPRHALGPYAASKAALEALLRQWRLEHPGLRFCNVRVGGTQPTEFGDGFDPDLFGPVFDQWLRHGLFQDQMMDTAEVADVLVGIFAAALAAPGVGLDDLVLRSPSGVAGSLGDALGTEAS